MNWYKTAKIKDLDCGDLVIKDSGNLGLDVYNKNKSSKDNLVFLNNCACEALRKWLDKRAKERKGDPLLERCIFSKTSQVDPQTQTNLGGPNIAIYPLEPTVQEVVRELQAESPGIFDHITDIIVDTSYSSFGSVSSETPNTIRVNLNKIKAELASKGWEEGTPEYDEQLKKAIREVLVHEHAHTADYNPQTGEFPGGEAVAETAVRRHFGE
jgi:hypothetical protein